jgi:hypothetical protein
MGQRFQFFKQEENITHLFLLSIYDSGIPGPLSMFKPFMIAQGFNVKDMATMTCLFSKPT